MTENNLPLETASVTDRGLNERRPHNEDAMLSDPERALFIVADGVGGAEAGEVASQTTVEVIDEAFRHRRSDDDVEDLLEIAIQRANDSVYRQSREQPRLSMMATTVVALHIAGTRATVGHVGDSRLYRLTPDGEILRETEDHSIVEEEVRAGRMTAAQAANHPSRNVISRAVGAEATVEVDLNQIDFEPGTIFLLCSDGITRHVPDQEIAAVVTEAQTLDDACAELKRLCFERGAEDNLTAVIVRVGADDGTGRTASTTDEEVTLIREHNGEPSDLASQPSDATASILRRPFDEADGVTTQPVRASGAHEERTTIERRDTVETRDTVGTRDAGNSTRNGRRSRSGLVTLAFIILLAVSAAAAFLGGMLYERRSGRTADASAAKPDLNSAAALTEAPAPEPRVYGFEERKRAVDRDPRAEVERMLAESDNNPLAATDPEFLYLYGRALLLEDRQQDAAQAFAQAFQQARLNTTPTNGQLQIDSLLARIAALLRHGDTQNAIAAADDLKFVLRRQSQPAAPDAAAGNEQPAPGVTP